MVGLRRPVSSVSPRFVAIRKLEDELGVTLFERGGAEVGVTPIGQRIVAQAQKVLEESASIKEIARQGHDPLAGPLRVGVIHTIGPYLLPRLVPEQIRRTPQMPLLLQENFTVRLVELLRQGEIDCAIMALPLPEAGLVMQPLYDEPFVVAVPNDHELAKQAAVDAQDLKQQTMLLLGSGHCFRDQVLEVCPELSRFSAASDGIQRTFEGSSLETIRHMVAAGIGVTVLPVTAVPEQPPRTACCVTCRSRARCRNAAWCWPGAAAFRDSRRSRRWRRPSMNAGCRACRCWRARSRQNRISSPPSAPALPQGMPRTGGAGPWHPACSFWLRRLVFGCSTQFIDCSSYRLSRINVEPPCGPKSVVAAVLSLLSPFNRSHRWPSPPRRPPVFRAST